MESRLILRPELSRPSKYRGPGGLQNQISDRGLRLIRFPLLTKCFSDQRDHFFVTLNVIRVKVVVDILRLRVIEDIVDD